MRASFSKVGARQDGHARAVPGADQLQRLGPVAFPVDCVLGVQKWNKDFKRPFSPRDRVLVGS